MQGRLQKLLAAAGLASRRQAEVWLRAGRVTVNGTLARLGDVADSERDRIEVDGEVIQLERTAYWLLHKPRGVLTTSSDPQGRQTVFDRLPSLSERVFPVGRLDRDSEGLLLLTNDGRIAHAMLHPSFGNEREYRVEVRGCVPRGAFRHLERGVFLAEGRTAPARVSHIHYDEKSNSTGFSLTLLEGRKRQIRRALAALGYPVLRLCRVRMGPLELGDLRPGQARSLSALERRRLLAHVEGLETGRTKRLQSKKRSR